MDNNKQLLVKEYIQTMIKASRLGTEILGVSIQDKAATILQMHALLYLKENPNSSVGQLADALHMSSPAITQFTNRLQRNGFVVKKLTKKTAAQCD